MRFAANAVQRTVVSRADDLETRHKDWRRTPILVESDTSVFAGYPGGMATSGVRTCAAVGGTRATMMAMGLWQCGQRCSPLAAVLSDGTGFAGLVDVVAGSGTTLGTSRDGMADEELGLAAVWRRCGTSWSRRGNRARAEGCGFERPT
jgi:hypothetical protein